jgi:hypothetical protein
MGSALREVSQACAVRAAIDDALEDAMNDVMNDMRREATSESGIATASTRRGSVLLKRIVCFRQL